ncbi:SH3 domain-containing protein [Bdellovibrio sp. HCB209]|uniref:SH3 domain-containing protein n=1 Tax=Bdellovibrio sp. HCB209 TaxID=3394354 RepID=UPI0039B60FEC
MFGLCALSSILRARGMRARAMLLFSLCLIPTVVLAQAQKGTVIADEAQIYKDPDFDAPVMTVLKQGQVFAISKGKKGPFYKIRLKPGVTGWISDAEIRPGVIKAEDLQDAHQEEEAEESSRRGRKPFFATRYRGLSLDFVDYAEDTMGARRNAQTMFYGLKFHGYNTLFSGDMYTESNILFHSGAPSYYQDYTGSSGSGYIVILDFLFQTVLPKGKDLIFFYGFGPMLKYSHFDISLPGTEAFSADDMTLGAVFSVGAAYRIQRVSIRPDIKYYWEKEGYLGYSISVGLDF